MHGSWPQCVFIGHRSLQRAGGLAARQAKLRGVSLGKTVSDLLRKGLNASTPARDKHGLVVFHLPADSPKVTTDDVRRIEAEGV